MILLLLSSLVFSQIFSCLIAGQQIGKCSNNDLDSSAFCRNLNSYICIPAHNNTWSQYDSKYKDKQIQGIFLQIVQQELIDEYINGNASLILANNPSCYYSYQTFLCHWNFPACNTTTNASKPMCSSVCQNFQSNCGGNADACSIIYDNIGLGLDETC